MRHVRIIAPLLLLLLTLVNPGYATTPTTKAEKNTPVAPTPPPAPKPPVWSIPGWKVAQNKGPFDIPVDEQWVYRKGDTTITVTTYGNTSALRSFTHMLQNADIFDSDTTVIKQMSRQQYHIEGEDHLQGHVIIADWIRLPNRIVSAIMIGPREEQGTVTRFFYNRIVRKLMRE